MADTALWFKLWGSCLTDPSISNLSLSDFGAWAKLGLLVKTQGNKGELTIISPAALICAMFQVHDFETLATLFHRLPGIKSETFTIPESAENGNTKRSNCISVTFCNWNKYQGLLSTPRVQKHRFTKRIEVEGRNRREVEVTPPPLSPRRGDVPTIGQTLRDHPALKGKR